MPHKVSEHLKFRENSIYIGDGYEAEARTPALCNPNSFNLICGNTIELSIGLLSNAQNSFSFIPELRDPNRSLAN